MAPMPYLLLTFLLLAGCVGAPSADGPRAEQTVAKASPQPSAQPQKRPFVQLAGRDIAVTLADTPRLREVGLSGTPSLAPDTGMVLLFDFPQVVRIWMPDMAFALDVVFVSDGHVVHIEENAQPCPDRTNCPTFGPDGLVDYVLEVPAGSAARWGVKRGDAIKLVR